MSEFGDDNYDEFDDELFDFFGGEEPDTLIDDLVGTAYGHEPPYQPDTYDAYDSDDYFGFESGEDEYFDGDLNPLPALLFNATPPQSPKITSTRRVDAIELRNLRMEERVREAMKGKKFYGEEGQEEGASAAARHSRKRRKVERSTDKGIVGIDACEDKGKVKEQRGEAQLEAGNKLEIVNEQYGNQIGKACIKGNQEDPATLEPGNINPLGIRSSPPFPSSDCNLCAPLSTPVIAHQHSSPLLPGAIPLPILGTAKKLKPVPPISPPVSPPNTTAMTATRKKDNTTDSTTKIRRTPAQALVPKKPAVKSANGICTMDSGGGNTSARKRKANTPVSPERK